ncbi:hypothetical protein [Phytohabitans houttuyneae]|uniref:hypothetical protein n=1 Tax=Phytohabitans houttuyneae TaxID=1076126 RepID=UPI0015660D79|nr:hypothetical protein [Phytohabitans houttuyneae]
MKKALLVLLGGLVFLAGGVLVAVTGTDLVFGLMLIGFGLALLIGVPVIWGQARNDPRAGDRANWARGGYAVLSSLSMSLFGLVGLGMLIFGQPVDEDGDTYRVPDSPLQVRIFGAVLFLLSAGVVIYGAYRRRHWRSR